ncbi:MAG: UvrD-helicase domain-containing protein, partial [Chthoniobacterales bacterium]|nr:UvrD-helicase domain-containing protein [Chthoniobacterales bacterium]
MSRLVPRFLLENKDLRLGQILLVTFTNDATAELAGRVRMVLEELYQAAVGMVSVVDSYYGGLIEQHGRDKVKKVVLRAILEADQLAVMTIHSFCARVLQVEGMLCGLPVMPEIVPSEGELMREILHRIWEEKVSNDNSLIAFASVGEMNFEKDLEFVRAALKERNVEFKPNKEDLGLLKDKIENLRKGKKEEGQKSFLELCRKIRDGNFCKNEFPSIEEISEKIQNFSKSWGEFLEAVDVVVGRIPEGINQRTKEGKDLFEEVKGSELFSSWKDVPLLVKRFCWSWRIELVEEVRKRLDDLGHTRRAISYDGLV